MATVPTTPAAQAGERVIRLPGGRRIFYDRLTATQRCTVDEQLRVLDEIRAHHPLMGFDWHSPAQRDFLAALTSIIAAFAGNRFGKSTILVVKALIELLPVEDLPDHLRPFKRFFEPTNGWILMPTEDKLFDSIMPALAKWCGPHLFKGGAIGKAFHGERMQLTFDCGSTLAFKTYKQDPSTLGGADLHFAGYDEPPPQAHREEVMTRLLGDDRCFEMFAMTPLNTNTGWVKREIYKKRASPGITIVRGSMHDNPTLSATRVAETLERYKNDLWRRAREFGDFIDVGGQIYEEFERRVIPSPDPATLRGQDIVVSIDNGIRNCGIVFGAFDNRGVCTIFDERLLQDAIPEQYVAAIREVLNRWGIPWTGHNAPLYVIDPASAARNQVSGVSVQTALAILGIGCAKGNNDVEAGVQQVRSRLACLRLWIAEHCTGLRDEADEYAAEDREDGHFKPIKRNDHRLDGLRYLCMARPFYPEVEADAAKPKLAQIGLYVPPTGGLVLPTEPGHMGSMS